MHHSLLKKLNYDQYDLQNIDGDLGSQLQPQSERFQMEVIKNMYPTTAHYFMNR